MPRAPVPSATGEQPCAAERSVRPNPDTLRIRRTPSVTRGALAAVALAWSLTVPLPRRAARPGAVAGRSGAPVVRERTGLGRQCRRVRRSRLVTGLRFDVLDVPAEAGLRGAAAPGADRRRSGGPDGAPDAAAGGRGQRRGAAGAARLAGVGRLALGSDGAIGRGRRHRGARCRPDRPGQPGPPVAAGDLPGRTTPQWGRAAGCGPLRPGAGRKSALPRCRPLARRRRRRPPISYGWWTRWRRNAIGSAAARVQLSRWPSRRPREWTREHGRGR